MNTEGGTTVPTSRRGEKVRVLRDGRKRKDATTTIKKMLPCAVRTRFPLLRRMIPRNIALGLSPHTLESTKIAGN